MSSAGAVQQRELMFMFERVGESLAIPRDGGMIKYDIPSDFYGSEYSSQANVIGDRFSENVSENAVRVSFQRLRQAPDLTMALKVAKRQNFCIFAPSHIEAASALIKIFMGAPDYEAFKSLAAYTHERVNTELWTYCFSVAITNRKDLRGIQVPSLSEIYPNKCVPSDTIQMARERATMLGNQNTEPIIVPATFTADQKNPEQRVAYFREDIGINLHHWHWHLVYPNAGDDSIVNKDRRGELFYYMHQQIMGRYNVERLCNDLGYVKPLDSFREPIAEGYYPKLDSVNSGRAWQGRPDNMPLRPINRDDYGLNFNAEVLETWASRIQEAIGRGQIENDRRERVDLTEQSGIDIIGNIVEATTLSVNRNLYGNLHNYMHLMVSLCHDPDRSHLEDVGIIGDLATTLRDPVFFRIHMRVNNIYKSHKDTLPEYGEQNLAFTGIRVLAVDVQSQGNSQKNVLETFWETSDIQLNRGMDFSDRGNIFARVRYLQHSSFIYTFVVENTTKTAVQGTVRIFIAPRQGENKRELRFEDQRGLMLELDKFATQLQPGVNNIQRRSEDSSVTIPYEQTFRRLMDSISEENLDENYCGCGWPQNMLIPKGRLEGMEFDLFLMVSDWKDDQVPPQNTQPGVLCKNSVTMCGSRNGNYPDRRSMGYPFDRVASQTALLSDFIRNYPNMRTARVSIRHFDRVVHKAQK